MMPQVPKKGKSRTNEREGGGLASWLVGGLVSPSSLGWLVPSTLGRVTGRKLGSSQRQRGEKKNLKLGFFPFYCCSV